VSSVEDQDTEISEFINDGGQLLNVQGLADDDVLFANKPSIDMQNVGELKIKIKFKNEY